MGSKCCKCGSSKTISGQRSISTYATYPKKRSRTRRRMVGDDLDIDEIVEDDRFSEPQWSASGHPVLARRLSDLSVKVGARARFLVEVSSPTPVSVRWEKDGRTVDESDRINLVTEGNFHCLDISPVNQDDGGLWRVKVTNMVGTAMSSAQLTLLVPKAYKKPEFVEPLRAVLTAQGTVSLECKVIGVPTPLLRWFKGSNEIKAGDVLALTPNASDPTSLGTYTCLAANCMGTAESTSIVHIDGTPATVQGFLPTGPKPIFAKELRNEKVKLGGSITLQCKVTVPPWPEAVNWYGPKGEVVESSRTHLIEDGAGLYSLKISTVNAEDNGTWKCVATNKHGAKAMSTSLISVNYPKNYRKPKFLESLKAVLTEEGLVSFECKVVGYPTPNLSWFKDGQELKPGDVYQLTGTNSLGSYCCIARNCMGEAQSSAELTLEDIKSQLSEEEKVQLSSEKLPPRFVSGLKSVEAKINESLRLSIKVSVFPEPTVIWFRDDEVIEDSEKYKIEKDKLGVYHMNISKLEFCDQAEWKCVATNDYGQSVTSSFVKLNIPKHFKKPKFLEDLKAVMSEEGAVNLECKVIGVPQPKLKWFKDGKELKPGDIHKIISGQDGTCCLGTYTCLAQNCMGSVSSSASLLGFEEKGEKSTGVIPDANRNGQVLSRDRSLSTIHEERTSQLHDTDKSTTIDDRAEEVSFSFDGKEVSVSLYETPDLTEEEALQIVEMYADQISEHVTEQNVVELPPMRFTKESSTSGKLLMEAVVIDVNPEYFSSTPAPRKVVEDDLRTDADVDEFSLVEELNTANLSPDRNLSPIENLTMDKVAADFAERTPSKPPRSKTKTSKEEEKAVVKEDAKVADDKAPQPKKRNKKKSTDSEKEDDSLQEFERRKNQNSQKQTSEQKRTDSEMEDDSLYEFESRKTRDDVFKSCKEDEPYKYSTETGVARTPENESQFYSPMKSPLSVASKMTEDEATFNTAEDSAFDKSEMSVLETLAHSLHEIQKNLTAVELHVVSDSSTGDMQSAQGISEYLAEPLAEVQKSLEIVEAQIQEFPEGKYSSDVLETLIQPITKFKKNLALLEEKSLPSILESVAGPLEELNREISYIQQATQSQIEYAKSVEQVQESLTKIIERQASVPSDRKLLDTISTELEKLEEKANDDLETYYDRLLTVGSELRSKANLEQDQEVQDILRAVGDLVKPLKRLTAVTSKCIAVIVEDNKMGNIPSKKIVESLLKPLDALNTSLSLIESVAMLKSHKTIRGAGIPILYKVSVPMEELETTVKLVENLSAHSAVEFLIPPLDNLIKVVSDIDVSTGGDGFLEDLQGEGTPIVKNLDDSLDIMLNCINSVDKGVAVVESERGIPGKLPALLKPMEDLQKSLKVVEKGIMAKDIGYEDVYAIAQEISKPLQSIRSEFSILQHEIEADHYCSEPNPSQTALNTLVEPLESVQNCISSFHETIMCKSADDPMHLRFVLYALKELTEPLSSLSGKMIKAEEVLLGKGDPFQGLKAVARSVSELRESSSAVNTDSNVIEHVSNILSEPLNRVQIGLENILQFVDKKDKQDLNRDLLKSMDEPFKDLQSALLKIEGNIHENVTEGVTPELRQAVQELQRSILIIQDQSSFEYGDEPSTIEANIDTLQSLTQPLQTLHAQFSEVQRSANRTLMKAERALVTLKDSTRRVSSTIAELKSKRSGNASAVIQILQVLGDTVEELETAVEDANSHLGRGKRVDNTRHILANTLKVASSKLGEVCSKADDMSVAVEPSKRKSLVLVQDFIHNLKVAIEQSTKVIDCDKGTAVDRSRDTLIAIEQLATAMSQFHVQLKSVDEFTASASAPQGMIAIKEQVDKLQTNVVKALTSNIPDKNDKMILETIENDVKSVQRVLDNLLSEDAADGARVRFILAKTESIHADLKDMVQSVDSPIALKTACQAALTVLDIGEGLMNRKSPMRIETVTQSDPEPEVSVIGELLETMDELDRCFNKLKREAKIKMVDKEVAEMAMEIATLQALVQDVATQASGELLDKVVEVCIPIKAIEVKLSQATNITASDLEQTSESLHSINQVLNSAIRKKEADKLVQPSTSIIGELLETVGDLEAAFDRLKRAQLPNVATDSAVNDVGREILALQNIVDDLTSEATGELLDRAQEICIPIKSIESILKHYAVLDKTSICEVKEKLKTINNGLKEAIAQNEIDKQKREKEFEKLFSSDSLSSSVDVPIVRSIVTTVEYMQAHLNSLIVPPDMVDMKNFLEKFECSLVRYGECLTEGWKGNELQDHISDLEAALITCDFTRVEMRKLGKAVESLKASRGEMSKALPALQSVLSPLKNLHEELSRPNSPKRLKKAELKYLESFSKSSTDLELGLMKMEKAVVTGTKLEVDCMATPVEQLASFIDGISHEPSLKNLDEESSIAALQSLAQPIKTIQIIVAQVQEAVVKHDDKKAAELLTAIAKPVRELRTNIALIQDQAMMNCSLSQLDELKQAVALMTQVGTETPGLKQPLLQLQARLQELEPEAELAEVVSELTGPVDALKQAVNVLETKGESSMLLELCHQVVEIINKGDDTLSEMSSIGHLSTKAEALPADALLKAATLCHELMEDHSLSELSHTDDTLTPTHAAEQLPSVHGAAVTDQHVLFEQVERLMSSPLSLQEADAKGASVAGNLKAGLIGLELLEDQTISEMSELDNSITGTMAVEKLPSIRGTLAGEQKMVLEEAESFEMSLKSTTEARAKGVPQEHLKIATTEINVLEDHSLSELSPNELTDSGTLPLEKLTSVRGTVAGEETMFYEHAQSLDTSVESGKEAEIKGIPVACQLNAASTGLMVLEEHSVSQLPVLGQSLSTAVGSPKLNVDLKEAAVADHQVAVEQTGDLSDRELSMKEVSMKDVSERQSAQASSAKILDGPSQLSIVEALLGKDMKTLGSLIDIISAITQVSQIPRPLSEKLATFKIEMGNIDPKTELRKVLVDIHSPMSEIEKISLKFEQEQGKTPLLDACFKTIAAVKKEEKIILDELELTLKDAGKLLTNEKQDIPKLKKALEALVELPPLKQLHFEEIQKPLIALNSELDQLSPLAKPVEILKQTINPIKELKQVLTKLGNEVEQSALDVCKKIVEQVELGAKISLKEASELLKEDAQDVTKFKKAVAILVSIPNEEKDIIVLEKPLLELNAILEKMGPLTKPEEVLRQTVEPLNALKICLKEIKMTEARTEILEVVQAVFARSEKCKQVVQEEVAKALRVNIQDASTLKKAVSVMVSVANEDEQKAKLVSPHLIALQAKLDELGPSAKPEDILKGTIDPVSTLKTVVADLKKSGEKSQLLDICELLIQNTELGKQAMQQDVAKLLKGETRNVTTLKKAVAILIDVPIEKALKLNVITQPLKSLQAKLETLSPKAQPLEILRVSVEPVQALKQVVSDLKKSGEKSELLEMCELVVERTESCKEELEKEAEQLLKSSKLRKAVAVLVDIPKESNLKVCQVNESLVALQGKLDQLGESAKPEEILRGTLEPLITLKQAVSEVKCAGEKSKLLNMCEKVIEKIEEGKTAMQQEAINILKENVQHVPTLKTAVATLVNVTKIDEKQIQIYQPLAALQAKLEMLNPAAEPIEVVRGTLEPVTELKQVLTDLKKSGETSQLLEICELVISNAEKGKGAMLTEATKLLAAQKQSITTLQKAVALLVDIPKDTGRKISKVNEPLKALQAKLETLGPSSNPEEILKCTIEPVKSLKEIIADVTLVGEKSELIEICQMVVKKAEEGKENMQEEVEKLLNDENADLATFKKAVATLVDIPKDESQQIASINHPLMALKTKLGCLSQKAEPIEILRSTLDPVSELKQVVSDLKQSGEKSQLLDICQLVIQKAEDGKEAMQTEAAKLLKGDMKDSENLKKAVALLIDVPKDNENLKMSVVNEPLVALHATLESLGTPTNSEEVIRCTIEPIKALEGVVTLVKQTGQKGQLLDICQLIIDKVEECKGAMQREVIELLKSDVGNVTTLKKAVSTLVNIPQDKEHKAVEMVTKPLSELKAKLEKMNPKAGAIEITKGTVEPVKALKQVVRDLKKSGDCSQLIEACELVIRKTEKGKTAMEAQAAKLLRGEMEDPLQLKEAVSILVSIPKDDELKINSIDEPLIALHKKLESIFSTSRVQEIVICSVEPVRALGKVVREVKQAGEKSDLLEISELVLEKFEQCKDAMQKEAEGLLAENSCDVTKLKKAVGIVLDIPKDVEEKIVQVDEPLSALKIKLDALSSESKPEDIVRGTSAPIQVLKSVVSVLKKDRKKSKLLDVCGAIIVKAEQGKALMQKEAAQLVSGELKDVTQLKKAVSLLIDVPKDKEDQISDVNAPLISLQAKLDKLPANAKPGEIQRETEKHIKVLEQVVTKLDAAGHKSSLAEICHSVVKHVESGREKAKELEDIGKMIKLGVTTIQQLSEVTEILSLHNTSCEPLKQPINDLKSKLSFLHKSSNIEDFIADLIEPMKTLKKTASSLEKVSVQNDLVKNTMAVIDHLEPIFLINNLELEELKKKEERAKKEEEKKQLEKKENADEMEKLAKEEQEKNAKVEQQEREKKKKEEEEKEKVEQAREEEKKAKLEQEKKEKDEVEKKVKLEQEKKEKEEEKEKKAKLEQAQKEKEKKEKKAKLEHEQKEKEEKEKKEKLEQERKEKEEKEKKAKLEQEKKEKDEKEKKEKLEQERKEKEEKEKKAKLEQEKKEKDEKEKKEKLEREWKEKEEVEKKAKQEQEMKEKEEKEKNAKLEQAQKEKEKKEKKAKLEQEQTEKEEKEKKEKLEQERKEKEEKEKKAKLEQEKKEKDEKEKKEKLERERKEKEEKEKKAKLEQEKKEKDEKEKKEKLERERKEKEEKEKKAKLEQEKEENMKKAKLEQEKKEKEEKEKKAKLEQEQKEKEEKKEKEKLKQEQKEKEEKEKKAQLELEKKEKDEKEKKEKLERERKEKEEKEKKAKLEQEKKEKDEKEKLERERKEKEEVEKKAKQEQEKEENMKKAKLEQEKKEKEEKEKKAKLEQAQKEKEEKEKKAKLEQAQKEKEEKEKKAKLEQEKKEKDEKEKKEKLEQERKEKEEAEKKAKQEQEKEEKEGNEKKAKLEQGKKEKEEEEKKANLEQEKKEKEKKAKLDQERKEKDEKEKKAKLEQDKKEKEEKEKKEKLEQERKEKEEKEKKAKLEQEKKEKDEKEKKEKLELEKKEKEENEKKAILEQEKKEKEEEEKKAKLEQEKKEKEKNAKLEQEKKEKDEKEKKAKSEQEKKEQQEKEKNAKVEQEKKDQQEKEKMAKSEQEKKEQQEKEKNAKLEQDKKEDEKKETTVKLEQEKEDNVKKAKLKQEEQEKQSEEREGQHYKNNGKSTAKLNEEEKKRKEDVKQLHEERDSVKQEEERNLEEEHRRKCLEDEEKAELDKKGREKQQSLSSVDDLICKGVKTIAQLKQVVEIMRLYKHVCTPLAEPLDGLSVFLETLYDKAGVNDFVLDLIQPMLKLKRASISSSSQQSGLLNVCLRLLEHLEPVLHLGEVDRKEKQREEVERLKKLKEEEELQGKATRRKEEELEKERIDAELRKEKAKAEEEKKREELRKKQQKEQQIKEKMEDDKKRKESIQHQQQDKSVENDRQAEQIIDGGNGIETEMNESLLGKVAATENSRLVEDGTKSREKLTAIPDEPISKEMLVGETQTDRQSKNSKAKEEVDQRAKELEETREKERRGREEKLIRLQQEREKVEEEERRRREKEKVERETRAFEDKKKLEKEKEEVEQRERNIKAKLEQVKREKRELEMEEQNKLMNARKQERERQEQEETSRKEKEEAKIKMQHEREQEMKKQRLKELERREAELESIRSRESLRMAHLDDVCKREVAKGISKSLDAVYLSSAEKLYKGPMEYSASVTTMNARDAGVHSARGISVVELMDYQPPPIRPERMKKYDHRKAAAERDFDKQSTIPKWDSRLRDLSPDTRRRPKEFTAYTPPSSNQDMTAHTWDKSKEQSWRHLEYPTPDYESPSSYHRSRRSISPMRDFGSSQSISSTRYQAAPQPVQPHHRSRRSLSPLERSLNQPYTGSTVSLTSIGSRKHIDELTSARIRPPTPTRSYVPTRSSSITKPHQRAYIVNGLVDKTVIHGGKIRLSCNIGGDPNPSIEWMKDGKSIAYHTEASRYKTECNYGVACLEVDGARLSDAGQYTCAVKNVDGQTATTCTVRVALNDDDDKEWESIGNELEANMPREICLSVKGPAFGMPRVTGLVADPVVPCGGTIAVHVQVAGCHRPEVTWLHGGAPLPKYSPRVHYFEDGGLFTLLLEGATPSESGVYTCRVSGRGRGAIDTATTVQVVEKRGHEKPAIFISKPDTRMTLTAGDDMTLTCYVGGEPRPQVMLTKGIKDITTSCRTLKEIFGEYVRLTLKRVTLEDRGTFFIIAKNIYGTDRTFVTLDVRERAKSLTPPSWSERTVSMTSLFKEVHHSNPSWRSAANLHSSYTSLYE